MKQPIWHPLLCFASVLVLLAAMHVAYPSQATAEQSKMYVSLGDSVAAGLGLPAAPNDPLPDSRCGRSAYSYPYYVAANLGIPFMHLACSGAKAGDLATKQSVRGPNIAPQLDAAFSYGTPALVTITAGANDAHWAYFTKKCYIATCGTTADTILVNATLTLLQAKLHYAFLDIQRRSSNQPPTVLISGYYNPLSAACTTNQQRVTGSEIRWLKADVLALNQTIKQVADRYSFVRYVPLNFSGHDLCSSDPWIQGIGDNAPVHPTIKGQQYIARQMLSAYGR